MTAYMLKSKCLAPYYGVYLRRATAEARLGSLQLQDHGYRVVRVTITEVGVRRQRKFAAPRTPGA